jgi:hypothetical protein
MATFHKRRNGDGSTSWDAMVRVVGYPPTGKSFPTKLAAELWAARTEDARRGRTSIADCPLQSIWASAFAEHECRKRVGSRSWRTAALVPRDLNSDSLWTANTGCTPSLPKAVVAELGGLSVVGDRHARGYADCASIGPATRRTRV